MEVNITVEDPDTFYMPWSAIKRYRRVREPMFEEVCAENNTPLFDYHILVAEQTIIRQNQPSVVPGGM